METTPYTWAPISLKDLVAQAEFLTRTDRKYVVPTHDASQILAELPESTRILTINGTTRFTYESTYFDTEDDQSYRDTALKRRRRFKVRTRSYVDTETTFLEVKTKSGRGSTLKERIPGHANMNLNSPKAQQFLCETLEKQGINPEVAAELSPTLQCRYKRMTLLLPDGARATIDTDLECEDLRNRGHYIALPHITIIETKTDGTRSVLDTALWRSKYRPTSVSKFATSLAALRRELSSNKWSRVLKRHFQETSQRDEAPVKIQRPNQHLHRQMAPHAA